MVLIFYLKHNPFSRLSIKSFYAKPLDKGPNILRHLEPGHLCFQKLGHKSPESQPEARSVFRGRANWHETPEAQGHGF